ncbi:uncharacterized protein CCDC197 [Pholidichthys leucotaenia]
MEKCELSKQELSSKGLEAGVSTLQKILVLKKQAELEEVDKRLALKQLEFKNSVEALAQQRSELEIKLQQTKERVLKFEKFVGENEVKRRRALKNCETSREQNIMKQRKIEELTEELKQLRTRKKVLKDRVEKYKIYEDYLMNTLDRLPNNYVNDESESLVMPIIRRHETLSFTYQELLQRLMRMEERVEQRQRQLLNLKEEHSIKKLMANKELLELQSELETLKEKNKQAEVNLTTEQGLSRQKVTEVGRLLMSINNLAEQCYLPAYGPLESMDVLTMMDMVKEYILDKADTERRARRLMESGSAVTSTTAESVTVRHIQFCQHRQRLGEPVTTFVDELRRLARVCGFGRLEKEMIQDQLVEHVCSEAVQSRLLDYPGELTLATAIELTQWFEAAEIIVRGLPERAFLSEDESRAKALSWDPDDGDAGEDVYASVTWRHPNELRRVEEMKRRGGSPEVKRRRRLEKDLSKD